MKNQIIKFLKKFGFAIIKVNKYSLKHKISDNKKILKVRKNVVFDILNFYDKIPPFYNDSIRDELQIKGAWKDDLIKRRPNQLDAIREKDHEKYSVLLENMFRNEMISGLFSISYFNKKIIGESFNHDFEYSMFMSKYITDLDVDILNDGDFGNRWGLIKDNKVITLADPYKTINAFNTSNMLNSINDSKNICYMDIGSGYGSDVIKTSKLSIKPTRTILFDIPLNLTTAYAYISMNTNKKCFLISSKSDLEILKDDNFSEDHFIFIPTIFAEELSSIKPEIKLTFNHGSFSEMDFKTVKFYLDTLLNNHVKYLYEINSNDTQLNTGNHIEVTSSTFPLPNEYKLLKRSITTIPYHRYLESLYVRES